jgi:hypothetical protein
MDMKRKCLAWQSVSASVRGRDIMAGVFRNGASEAAPEEEADGKVFDVVIVLTENE